MRPSFDGWTDAKLIELLSRISMRYVSLFVKAKVRWLAPQAGLGDNYLCLVSLLFEQFINRLNP